MSRLTTKTLLNVAALICSVILATGCGWKGEPVPEYVDREDVDSAYNDLSYTAVTGNASMVSAIAADLKGYINTSEGYKVATKEIGFLISRDKANPARKDADEDNDGTGYVKCIQMYEVADDNSMKTRVYGLLPFTKFYFRTYAILSNGETVYGVVKTFMTLNLTITMTDPPERIGLFDADLTAKIGGLSSGDYGTTARLKFRCSDGEIVSPTVPAEEAIYDETKDAQAVTSSEWKYTANVANLTPGKRYNALAFMEITSDFYDYATDNPQDARGFKYGAKAEDVATDKYKSNTISLTASALSGVRSFTAEKYVLDYDKITISDSYFSLPSDTLDASEYGVQISTDEEFTTFRKYASTDQLWAGNHYKTAATGLDLKTKYFYRAYVVVRGLTVCSQTTYTFTTKDYTPLAVDLGLSVKWADRNVGSWSKSVAGAYYSWGEVSQKDYYDEETFVGAGLTIKEIGGTEYDAATIKLGAGWRMPTPDEVKELFSKCTWKWVKSGDIYGYEITSDNENSIFLPAGGFKLRDNVEDYGEIGYYWTSQRGEGSNGLGQVTDMYFRSGMTSDGNKTPLHTCNPSLGLCIRAVYTK